MITFADLPKELLEFINIWKNKEGNLIMIFHEIQNYYGYVPREIAFELSEMLNIPVARIYEILTFYSHFKLEPPGKYIISVCMGTACYLKGALDLIKELENMLDVKQGEITEDGLFELQSVRCIGCCGAAPVLTVNNEVYTKVEKKDLHGIIMEYMKQEKEIKQTAT